MSNEILCIDHPYREMWHLRDRLGTLRGMVYCDIFDDRYLNWSWVAYPDTEEIFSRPPKGTARDFDDAFSQIVGCMMAVEIRRKERLPAQGDLFDSR
jgi:hypothetical protein